MVTLEYVRQRAESDANSRGYKLQYDQTFLNDLLEGLRKNEEKYGYPLCPCRMGTGKLELDRDIICPCDYRDPDVEEFGACYCALYIRKEIFDQKMPINPIPERRPQEKQARTMAVITGTEPALGMKEVPKPPVTQVIPKENMAAAEGGAKLKLWYCKQCGYVVFREEPPYICPICKARRELFAEIKFETADTG
jgi:ferredoxin-thioredoxin reductase catalytic subunit/rubredoxin